MVLNTVLTSHLGFQKRGQSKNTVVLHAGDSGRNRTIDTRIFSRLCDRFSNRINELKRRKLAIGIIAIGRCAV